MTDHERDQAIKEAERNQSGVSYFQPRSFYRITNQQAFDAGFDRGWDAATAPLLERIAELTEEVERFRADALNEKAARRELEAKNAQQAEAQEPVAWANLTEDGNIRIWSKKPESANWCGLTLVPLFTRPKPAQRPVCQGEQHP